jgi:hypothetical protein
MSSEINNGAIPRSLENYMAAAFLASQNNNTIFGVTVSL